MTCDPSQWNSLHSRARQTVRSALGFVEHTENLAHHLEHCDKPDCVEAVKLYEEALSRFESMSWTFRGFQNSAAEHGYPDPPGLRTGEESA